VRWESLFGDLAAQAEALERLERAAEVDERTRAELAALTLMDRLRAAQDTTVRVGVLGVGAVHGRIGTIGADWVLLDDPTGHETLVPVAAISGLRGLPREAMTAGVAGPLVTRLRLTSALRGIARDRSAVRLHLRDGSAVDATIDRVGRDYLEVAPHAPGEARRRREVHEAEVVPFAAIAVVRRLV
jgi:hypothetical protein